jgi:hypothetical protein
MKRLSTKWFQKWSKKAKLSNQNLLDAINALEAGLSTVNSKELEKAISKKVLFDLEGIE